MPVYKELLEFYVVAIRILSQGTLVLKFVSESFADSLPSIAKNFMHHA